MVVFDANFLIYFLDARIKNGVGGNPKIDHLVAQIQKANDRIVVPTPALSELLVKAGAAGPDYLTILSRSKYFRIADFDVKAAVEAAAITREALEKGGKKGVASDREWHRIKVDRQIIAIAKSNQAETLYTNDDGLAAQAKAAGLKAFTLNDLPDPPTPPQLQFALDVAPEEDVIEDDEG